jgi:prepilin-type N-terminal cleavage/methylation domain-containing protein
MKQGFTLIELLVVVLIIGILAGVALPQYQKAVMKSRFAEAMTNMKSLGNAMKVCKLADPNANCSLDELDIEVGSATGDGGDYETANFHYEAYSNYIAAEYKKESVCLCYNIDTNTFGISDEWEEGVHGAYCYHAGTPSFDYKVLLNIGVEPCTCC